MPEAQTGRVALLGGSFDPPHLGHVLAVCWAMAMAEVDAIWVLPTRIHPYGKDLSPWEQRLALCRLAFAHLPFVTVREDEQDNPSGYTIDLVRFLMSRHPHIRWFLIGGSDTVADLDQWREGAALRELVRILPVPRRGFTDDPTALPAISSSRIRAQATAGEDITSQVPRRVFTAIRNHGWYGVDPANPPV